MTAHLELNTAAILNMRDAVNLVRAFAKYPDRTALTDSFIESLKLLADTVESQMKEVK
jgi:hypothetical protein